MIYIYLHASKHDVYFGIDFLWEKLALEAVLEYNKHELVEVIYDYEKNPKELIERDAKCYFIDEWVYGIYNHGVVEDLTQEVDLDEITEEVAKCC